MCLHAFSRAFSRACSRALTARLAATGAAGLAGLALVALGGCAIEPIEPWVKPYDRERLADPIMKLGRDELSARQFDHIYTVREGARGATGVQGGGCGCN